MPPWPPSCRASACAPSGIPMAAGLRTCSSPLWCFPPGRSSKDTEKASKRGAKSTTRPADRVPVRARVPPAPKTAPAPLCPPVAEL